MVNTPRRRKETAATRRAVKPKRYIFQFRDSPMHRTVI